MKITIHFEDKTSFITPDIICHKRHHKNDRPLIFQHQMHGNHGLAITPQNIKQYKNCLTYESDYLITTIPNIWIGVLTADCLPIAIADEQHEAIGIIHAGWRGTIGKIAVNAINHMRTLYGTQAETINVFLGPCALPCCYEVDQPFIENLPKWAKKFITKNAFDVPACNIHQLTEIGVKKEHIDVSRNQCTICNENFCSYRKNPLSKARQMSIISLH